MWSRILVLVMLGGACGAPRRTASSRPDDNATWEPSRCLQGDCQNGPGRQWRIGSRESPRGLPWSCGPSVIARLRPWGMFVEGEFVAGELRRGTVAHATCTTCPPNRCYEGELRGGNAEGTGKVFEGDRLTYEGELVDGQPDGRGTLFGMDQRYEGELRGGDPDGRGRRVTTDGRVLEEGRYAGKLVEGTRALVLASRSAEDPPLAARFTGTFEGERPLAGTYEIDQIGTLELRGGATRVVKLAVTKVPFRYADQRANKELLGLAAVSSLLPREACLVGDCYTGVGIAIKEGTLTRGTFSSGVLGGEVEQVSAAVVYTRGPRADDLSQRLHGRAVQIDLRTGGGVAGLFVNGVHVGDYPSLAAYQRSSSKKPAVAAASPSEPPASPQRVALRTKNRQAMSAATGAMSQLRALQVELGGPRGVLGATLANMAPAASNIRSQLTAASNLWYGLSQDARGVSDARDYASALLALHRCFDTAQRLAETMINNMHAAGQARDEGSVLAYARGVENLIKEISSAALACERQATDVADL